MKTYYDIALRDLQSAKIMLDAGIYNNVVRFCQQYVEKIFKERIHISGDTEADQSLLFTHKILRLARRCGELSDITFTKDEIIFFNELSTYYFDTNYPGDDYIEVDGETAQDAYQNTLDFQSKYEYLLIEQKDNKKL